VPGGPTVRLPQPPLPEAEDVEERDSLEGPALEASPRVVSLETMVRRPERGVFDQNDGAEALVRRRIVAAEAAAGRARRPTTNGSTSGFGGSRPSIRPYAATRQPSFATRSGGERSWGRRFPNGIRDWRRNSRLL
jgi:hypothetical protein